MPGKSPIKTPVSSSAANSAEEAIPAGAPRGSNRPAAADNASTTRLSDWQLYKRLLSYMWPYVGTLLISFAGFMVFASMEVLLADILQFLVDALGQNTQMTSGIVSGLMGRWANIEPGDASSAAILIPSAIVAIAFVRGIGSFVGTYAIAIVGRKTIHDLRKALFEHLLKLPTAFFDASAGGFLVSRITFNVEQVTGAVTKAMTVSIREGLNVIFLTGFLLYLNWKLSLVFVVTVPFIALIVNYVSKRFRRFSRRIQESMGEVTHVTTEAVNGHRVIRIFGGETYESDRFAQANRYNLRQSIKMAATGAGWTPVIQFTVSRNALRDLSVIELVSIKLGVSSIDG